MPNPVPEEVQQALRELSREGRVDWHATMDNLKGGAYEAILKARDAELRERLEPLIRERIECSCTWDLDEAHPDFGVEGTEEPLKVVRSDLNCPQHTTLALLNVGEADGG